MNVLYAGFNNPISVTAAGGNAGVHLTMTGGSLVQRGPGKYTARPARVGEHVTFTVSGTVNGKAQNIGPVYLPGAQTARPDGLYTGGSRPL